MCEDRSCWLDPGDCMSQRDSFLWRSNESCPDALRVMMNLSDGNRSKTDDSWTWETFLLLVMWIVGSTGCIVSMGGLGLHWFLKSRRESKTSVSTHRRDSLVSNLSVSDNTGMYVDLAPQMDMYCYFGTHRIF